MSRRGDMELLSDIFEARRRIHFYFGVNLDIVWSVAKTEIIELRKKIWEILRRESL